MDALENQQIGRPIEIRAPNVTLQDSSVQLIHTSYNWNEFGQLRNEIDAEGYVDEFFYYPENAPSRLGEETVTLDPPDRYRKTLLRMH